MFEVSPVRAILDARPVGDALERRVSAIGVPAHHIDRGFRRIDAVRELRQRGDASLPTTIAPERELVPSLHCRVSGRRWQVQESQLSRLDTFMTAPSWKDGLR